MPDEASSPTAHETRGSGSAIIDMDQILEFIRLGNERRSEDITVMAERVAMMLAEQLGQVGGRGERLDEGLIRAYAITRRQLAGPNDDEADSLSVGTIVSVTPHTPRVGRTCQVLLRNAGRPVRVDFAGQADVVESKAVESKVTAWQSHDREGVVARSYGLATVTVPEGAISGKISAVTESGILTSDFDVRVAAAVTWEYEPGQGALAASSRPPRSRR
ncbi:hypothetical protein [Frankia sp. Cppng1_Ct_nod]|uniref:hypothetical protein n=1 Tax=Frankia sp. Cppng1_Ct_nod TaxID=2897162 RepID=UPI0020242B0C|nr:hypothetical protein [Frankia sp. Cppng1_Ct_nod]